MPKHPVIYHGIINPKGEPNSKITTFLNEHQLKTLSKNIAGVPIKIGHIHKDSTGKKIDPSGYILSGHVHPKTGELHCLYFLCDTPNGQIAKKLAGEVEGVPSHLQMQELSIGNEIVFQKGLPIANIVNEVSLCWKGARENTKVQKKYDFNTIRDMIQQKRSQENLKQQVYNILSKNKI